MNILVSGGCGFIGSTLIKHLLNNSDHQIGNIDKLAYAGSTRNLEAVLAHPRLHFFQQDICDRTAMTKVFAEFKPDLIFNLAGESYVDRSIDVPEQSIETNILGVLNLLQVSRTYLSAQGDELRKNFKFIQVSTDEVFGDLDMQAPAWCEDSAYKPGSPYSASKAGANHLVSAWHRTYGVPGIITHASNNYGPFQLPEKLVPRMILKALRAEPLTLYGDGQQIRNWLHVDDHVRGLCLVMEKGKPGESYNIGGNCELSNLQVLQHICDILEQKYSKHLSTKNSLQSNIVFVKDRPGHDLRCSLNSSRIERELGWKVQIPFEQGLEATIGWYVNHQDWCQEVLVRLKKQT